MGFVVSLLAVVYVGGFSGYMLAAILLSLYDRPAPVKTKIIVIVAAPVWFIVLGYILYNQRRRKEYEYHETDEA